MTTTERLGVVANVIHPDLMAHAEMAAMAADEGEPEGLSREWVKARERAGCVWDVAPELRDIVEMLQSAAFARWEQGDVAGASALVRTAERLLTPDAARVFAEWRAMAGQHAASTEQYLAEQFFEVRLELPTPHSDRCSAREAAQQRHRELLARLRVHGPPPTSLPACARIGSSTIPAHAPPTHDFTRSVPAVKVAA